jgi:hypothetical protein
VVQGGREEPVHAAVARCSGARLFAAAAEGVYLRKRALEAIRFHGAAMTVSIHDSTPAALVKPPRHGNAFLAAR